MGFKIGLATKLGKLFYHDRETATEKLSEIAVHPNASESQKDKATDAIVEIAKNDSQTKRVVSGISVLGVLGIIGTVLLSTAKKLKGD